VLTEILASLLYPVASLAGWIRTVAVTYTWMRNSTLKRIKGGRISSYISFHHDVRWFFFKKIVATNTETTITA
jgi:hypothetical protein